MTETKNVVLTDIRKTHVVELPSFKGSRIELYDGILFGDAQRIERIEKDFEKGIQSLLSMMKSWNFTDGKGTVLDITEDNLNQLPASDLTFLMEKISDFLDTAEQDRKKN